VRDDTESAVQPTHGPLGTIAEADLRAISSHPRFHAMDGLRGIAAMAIASFHSFHAATLVNAPLAVDLFFLLSGFVIASSYDGKLAEGMTAGAFLQRRLIRLYPMLAVAVVGGVLIAIGHNLGDPDHAYPFGAILTAGSLSILLLPYFGHAIPYGEVFAFNPPMWSLFFEIWVNGVYAVGRRWLNLPALAMLTIGGLVAIGLLGALGGNHQDNFLHGFPRVIAGFCGGVLLYRLWRAGLFPRIRGNAPALTLLILAIFAIPYEIAGWLFAPVFCALCAIVIAAANAIPSRFDSLCSFLGEASYPVYLTHWLTLYVVKALAAKFELAGLGYTLLAAAHLLALPFLGFALFHFYEKPVMLWLRRRFL
jgi:peptidoglycan/LPS O-acetylase OafA/YrhL